MITCMTVEEAAAALRIKPKNTYYLLYMGRLEGWKIRDCWRVFPRSVEEYVKSNGLGNIEGFSAGDPHDEGCRGVSSMLDFDGDADALGGGARGVYGRSRMEHQPIGLSELPVQAIKFMRRENRHGQFNPSQIEFNFGAAV